MKDTNMNDWMTDAGLPKALPKNKGIVSAIHAPKEVTTKFGIRKKSQVVIQGSDGSTINVGLFLPQGFPYISPKSNLGKIMALHGCTKLQELIGKEVEVVEVGEMLWNLKGGD